MDDDKRSGRRSLGDSDVPGPVPEQKQEKGMPPTRVRATNLRSGGQGSSPAALERAKKLVVLASVSFGKPFPKRMVVFF